MKQVDNLLECTKAMHTALERKDMALLDASCQCTIEAIKELEAIGLQAIPAEDRPKLREINIINSENYEMAKAGATEMAALLLTIRLNHR